MAKKKIGVTLEKALHQEVKSLAAKKGITIEEAYQQALESWLTKGQAVSAHEGPTDEVLTFVIDYLARHGPGSVARGVLLAQIGYPDAKASKINSNRSVGKKMG